MHNTTILYLGHTSQSSTSAHRANALRRLGHTVVQIDPFIALPKNLGARWPAAFHFRTGYVLLQAKLAQWLRDVLSTKKINPDLIWVDSGELMGPKCLDILQTLNCPVVLYNIDDPTGKRDGRRFASLIKAIPRYDLIVVVRPESQKECVALGAKRAIHVYRSYDELAHKPYSHVSEIPENFKSDVVFIGTWMRYEKRDEFLLELISNGIPVSIWGNGWQKSPHFSKLKSHWRGAALGGRDYVAAVQGSKICLGLLSKGNRDLHTTRSLEIPFAGGLFCAERTTDHQEMYEDGVEAVFWSDATECITQCKKLLENDILRENIRQAGMKRVRSLGVGNEDVCKKILNTLFETARPALVS